MSFGFDEKANPRKLGPTRKGAKPVAARRLLHDCEPGDVLRFLDGPPSVEQPENSSKPAPSEYGKVVRWQGETAVVRFVIPKGDESEYTEGLYVVGNPRIMRLEGYR